MQKNLYSAVINLPNTVTVSGSCDKNHSSLLVSWFNNSYVFKIEFGVSEKTVYLEGYTSANIYVHLLVALPKKCEKNLFFKFTKCEKRLWKLTI